MLFDVPPAATRAAEYVPVSSELAPTPPDANASTIALCAAVSVPATSVPATPVASACTPDSSVAECAQVWCTSLPMLDNCAAVAAERASAEESVASAIIAERAAAVEQEASTALLAEERATLQRETARTREVAANALAEKELDLTTAHDRLVLEREEHEHLLCERDLDNVNAKEASLLKQLAVVEARSLADAAESQGPCRGNLLAKGHC